MATQPLLVSGATLAQPLASYALSWGSPTVCPSGGLQFTIGGSAPPALSLWVQTNFVGTPCSYAFTTIVTMQNSDFSLRLSPAAPTAVSGGGNTGDFFGVPGSTWWINNAAMGASYTGYAAGYVTRFWNALMGTTGSASGFSGPMAIAQAPSIANTAGRNFAGCVAPLAACGRRRLKQQ